MVSVGKVFLFGLESEQIFFYSCIEKLFHLLREMIPEVGSVYGNVAILLHHCEKCNAIATHML